MWRNWNGARNMRNEVEIVWFIPYQRGLVLFLQKNDLLVRTGTDYLILFSS